MNHCTLKLRRWVSVSAVSTLLLATFPGCDQAPSAAPQPAPPPPAATKPVEPAIRRPTTQELDGGEWKTIPLSILPMTVRVPQSWQPVPLADAGLLTMEGWGPHGMVQIRFAARPSFTVDKIDGFVEGARKAMESRGTNKLKFEVRDTPDFKLLEQQYTESPRPMLATDDHGTLVEREGTPLKWNYLIFIRDAEGYKSYDLSFVDLSLEHFQQDKAFLQRILDSLTFDNSRKP